MLNIFKKKKQDENADPTDLNNMGMLQKMAMKKIMSMSSEEREKLIKKVMTPENISKNKDQLLQYLDQMERSGKMNKHQVFEAKKRLGLL